MEWAVGALIFATITVLIALVLVFRELRALKAGQKRDESWEGRSESLETLLAVLPHAVLVVDRDGVCLEEFSPADRGPAPEILDRLSDDAHSAYLQALRLAVDEGQTQQLRFLHEDRWYVAEIVPLPPHSYRPNTATVILRDVTAQKQSDSRAEQLGVRNEAILRSAMDGFFVVGEDYRFLEVNDAFCRMTGYEAQELLGLKISDLEVNEPPRGLGASTHARTGLHHFSTTHQHKDGHRIQLEISVIVLRDRGSKILVGFARDVTERIRAEEALRESEERFRRLSDLTFEGIAFHENGRITDANQSFARMFGYDLSEIVGGEGLDLVAPTSRARVSRNFLAGYDKPYKAIGLRKDGSTFPIDIRGRLIPQEGRRLMVCAIRDVTVARRAEQALRKSEKKYRDLVETSHDLIWALDAEGRWTFVNQAVKRICLYEPEELIGRPFTDFMTPEQAAKDLELFERTKQGIPYFQYETQWLRRDGTPVILSANAIALRDEQGNVVGVTGIATDITERKKAEHERQRLERRMQEAQKLESLGVLAGGVAHDFNNFLVGILCNTSLAMEALPKDSPSHSHLQKIITASRRASELTRQMLAYSGRATYDAHPLDVSALVSELADFLRATLPKNVKLEVTTQDDLPQIEADSGQIQQVLMNLLINGSEAIGDKPGCVTVATSLRTLDDAEITLDFAEQNLVPGRFVCLEVRDTGCGMTPETQARIFDPFFTTKFTGRGLGLAAILGIVRAHRGSIKVQSTLDVGTSFSVLFPALERPTQDVAGGEVRRTLPAASTVLVIDDEEDIREAVEAVLTGRGVRVLTAASGVEGLEIFAAHADEIGAVLLDMTMPGMNGDDVLQQILEIKPDASVILSSGYTEQEVIKRFGTKRLAGFVHKPYTPDVLVEQVGSVLERRGRLPQERSTTEEARKDEGIETN